MEQAIDILWQERAVFASGLTTTLSLVVLATLISLATGVLGAIALIEAPGALRRIGLETIDLLRCVPFLLLAYVVYYGLPEIGLRLPPWWAGLLTLALYNAAYMIEIFRSAMLAVPKDTSEAAVSLGMSRPLLYRRIVLPQSVMTSAPVIGNQIIMVLKDSALLMIITVKEITFAANFVNANHFSPFAPFALAVLLYWGLSLVVEAGVRQVSRLRRHRFG